MAERRSSKSTVGGSSPSSLDLIKCFYFCKYFKMYLLSITFPLIGSLICGFFGRYLGQRGAPLITTSSIILSCLCGLVPFYEVGFSGSPCTLELFTFIDSDFFFAS